MAAREHAVSVVIDLLRTYDAAPQPQELGPVSYIAIKLDCDYRTARRLVAEARARMAEGPGAMKFDCDEEYERALRSAPQTFGNMISIGRTGLCYLLAALDAARADAERWRTEAKALRDAGERLWGVVANATSGDWSKQSGEWQAAAAAARDEYFALVTDAMAAEDRSR